jgi:DNA/RNA endonuclease G (NUC1)
MKTFLFVIFAVGLCAAAQFLTQKSSAQKSPEVSPHLVISQFQAGGAANFNDEFVEIHNTSSSGIDLNGYRVVYRSASGTNDVGPFAQWSTSTIIPAGGYYLIATTSYDGTSTPNITYDPAACACSMGANAGGLAIKNASDAIIDSAGWGTATNAFVEGTVTSAPGNDNSKARKQSGCQDTDNNANDFETLTPSAPRNSSTTPFQCAGSGANLFASISANPTSVVPGGNTLLTISVVPATTPPSTFITVAANLQSIGGASSQTFFDNGTNGDVTTGDNVFSFLATVAPGTPGGLAPIAGAAADLQGRTAPVQLVLTINAPQPDEDPLLLGNPSNATPDIANENNYLMVKPQYSLSYDRSEATPNWVAWRLDSVWIGSSPVQRQDDFRPDTTLPAGWYQVTDLDYSNSGYTRGHMCPSGDRTNTIPNNSATFLMTNMVPQTAANNTGPWEDLESYCRFLAGQGNELYIISGPNGNIGTIGSTQQNRIVVPNVTWKVVLVLPNGTDDLNRVAKSTRAFGVIMSNQSINQNAPWRNFRVTVNAVENLTGYDFFSNVPRAKQELIERQHDTL